MRLAIETGLPHVAAPIEWATIGGDTIYIPIRSGGTIEDGDITAQAKVAFSNLEKTLKAAGCTLDDATQIQIFLADKSDFAAMNAFYKTVFKSPYPNRSTSRLASWSRIRALKSWPMRTRRANNNQKLRVRQGRLTCLRGYWSPSYFRPQRGGIQCRQCVDFSATSCEDYRQRHTWWWYRHREPLGCRQAQQALRATSYRREQTWRFG
jgi:enamine deaminase RidA (YjgF/YER057c/UK114 family)